MFAKKRERSGVERIYIYTARSDFFDPISSFSARLCVCVCVCARAWLTRRARPRLIYARGAERFREMYIRAELKWSDFVAWLFLSF